jgi:hypothetical protein
MVVITVVEDIMEDKLDVATLVDIPMNIHI